jgi:hypothetical protein
MRKKQAFRWNGVDKIMVPLAVAVVFILVWIKFGS